MSARFLHLEALFDAALAVPAAQRAAWCAEHCAGDAVLERELLALLAKDEQLAHTMTLNPLRYCEPAFDAAIERTERPDARVGPYHLREEIGRGGMGRVLRAVRYEDGVEREVAIKFVRRELLDETTRRRFRQELRALAALDHPGIARLLEGGETDDGTPYVVMELVRGESLLDYCAARKLGVRARVDLFRQVLAAVAHAHRNLIVHRDLKPGNVLVDAHDRVRLLDFGLAKPLDASPGETATHDRYLTPAYAAPEQWRGGTVGVACDVYSLGALLYELLAGRPPFRFEGLSAAEIERLVFATPPPAVDAAVDSNENPAQRLELRDLLAWRKQLRGDLDTIVQKALRKEPEQRYLGVDQFDDDLGRYLEGKPVGAAGGSTSYRIRKFAARHRLGLAAASALTAAAIASIAAIVYGAAVAREERDRAQAALAIMRDSFKSADPLRLAGPQLGAREILAAAAERLRGLDASSPRLFCELAAEIADAQLSLGIYEREAPLTARALELAPIVGMPPSLLHRLRALDATRRLALHDSAGADAILREAEAVQGDDPKILSARAYYWQLENEPARGIPLAVRAAQVAAGQGDTEQHGIARLQLAELLHAAGRPDESLAAFDALVAAQTAELGDFHPRTLSTRLRRVLVLSALERHDDATKEAEAMVEVLPERFGDTSAVVARSNSVLGHARLAAGDPAGAVPAYDSATKGYAHSLGQHHSNTLRARFNLAHVLARSTADVARIDATFERVIEDAMPRGPDDRLMWYFRAQYAKTLLDRGDRAKAARVLLPPGLDPNPAELDETNRAEYLQFLRTALEPSACDPASGTRGDLQRRAALLLCPGA